MKKLLITGANGFIGSNCAKYFKNDYEIFGIDIAGNNEGNFIKGEVDDISLAKFNVKFDAIIHLAGTSTVLNAQSAPEIEHTKTVKAASHLLDFVLKNNKAARLVFVSSAALYGNSYNRPIKECDTTTPFSIYGKHKKELEELCFKYQKQGLNFEILRLFSVYGEGLRKQILWDFSNRIKENFNKSSINCYGTGDERRDYIHITDVMQLIKIALNIKEAGLIINGGSGISTKISEVLEQLKQEYKYAGALVYDNIEREGNPKELVADISLAKTFGYKPQMKLREGIKLYAKWFEGQS